jgi:ectoine hydroxylase-related dioxygenase (phytanoyl-CoA dioxygenase family)
VAHIIGSVRLSPDQLASYRENGFLVVPDLIDRAEVDALLAEGTRICRGERGPIDGLQACAPHESDIDVLRKYLLCTYVHNASPLFREMIADERFGDLMEAIIGPNVKGFFSQFFIKHAGMPGNAWHQDENFLPTRDRSLTSIWIALDPATEENGCMRFIPGSHKAGYFWPMRPHRSADLDHLEEAYDFPGLETAVTVELAPGSAVVFSGYVMHGSWKNRTTDGFRRSLLYQYASAETPIAFHPRSEPVSNYFDNRDFVLVRGFDPYAWKAKMDGLNAPILRGPGAQPEDVVNAEVREREKVPV